MHDLLIVGGGPAGLAASVYAARKQLRTLLLTVNIGGQVNTTWGIENYLGYQFIEGPELIAKFEAQVRQFPIDQKLGVKVTSLNRIDGGFEATADSGEKYQAKAVILATGKSSRRLNVPGESEFAGRGVSYCAVCDGPVFARQRVAVVGGGNSGVGAALDMVKIAEHVSLVALSKLTGDPVLTEQLGRAKNLTIYTEHQTLAIKGEKFVEGMVIKGLKTGEDKELKVTGIFVEIGLVPNSNAVKGLVKLNKWGEVPVNCNCETEIPGLFAAGDVTDAQEKQIIIAAGEGAKAALQAHLYLQRLSQ